MRRCEAEESCLHAVVEDYEGYGCESVEIADDTVFCGIEEIYIQWDETPVEEASDDAAESVDCGIFQKCIHS